MVKQLKKQHEEKLQKNTIEKRIQSWRRLSPSRGHEHHEPVGETSPPMGEAEKSVSCCRQSYGRIGRPPEAYIHVLVSGIPQV